MSASSPAICRSDWSSYTGPVTPGICGVFGPRLQPRYWYRSGQSGGSWVMGLDWLIPWMEHFGHEHGLGVEDVARLRRAGRTELVTARQARARRPCPTSTPRRAATNRAGSRPRRRACRGLDRVRASAGAAWTMARDSSARSPLAA